MPASGHCYKKKTKHPVLGRGLLEAGMSANDVGSLCVTRWFIHNVNRKVETPPPPGHARVVRTMRVYTWIDAG